MPTRHKLYLVTFKTKSTDQWQSCYKPGYTHHIDVTDRFQSHIQSHTILDFRVLKSSYFSSMEEAFAAEQDLIQRVIDKFGGYRPRDGVTRFHNFWSTTKHNGITEMRKYNQDEVDYCRDYIENNGKQFF